MNLSKTWLAAVLLGSLAVCALGENLFAQTWQPARPADDGAAPANNWEQRVLKRPQEPQPQQQQPLQWQSGQPTSNPSGRNAAQYPTAGQDSMVIQAAAISPIEQPANPRPATRSYQTARRNAFDNVFDDAVPREPVATPAGQRTVMAGTEVGGPEVLAPGAMRLDPLVPEGAFVSPGGCNHCGTACEGEPCDGCGGGCGPACGGCDMGYEIFDGSCGWWIKNLTISAGVQGFKGPLDRGANGDFGLNEGVGFSGPVGDPWNVGYQIGANFLQSNFTHPDTVTLDNGETFRAGSRNQTFVTAGLFRRALCGGLQGGVAYDYFHDDYYVQYDLQQIRSEISWVFPCCEIGYYGAYGVSTAQPTGLNEKLAPTDMFTLYVRHEFENGGEGRIWGGATGNGDGVLGGEIRIPLGRSFALENRLNFLIPNSTPTSVRDNSGQERESWGLMMQLVWYPGRSSLCQQRNLYRPLFSTADDSLFMVDRLTK